MRASLIVLVIVVLKVVLATRFILKKEDGTEIRGDFIKFRRLLVEEFGDGLKKLPDLQLLEKEEKFENKKNELGKLRDNGILDDNTARTIFAGYVFDFWEDVFHGMGFDLKFYDRDGDDIKL